MKKLLSFILLLVGLAQAAVDTNSGTSCLPAGTGGNVAGNRPMTVAGWVNSPSATSFKTFFAQDGGPWKMFVYAGSPCTLGHLDFRNTNTDVCSSQTVSGSTWEFIAAVVTTGNVHFLTLANNATTPTTDDVSNSTTFGSAGRTVGGAFQINCSFGMSGAIANLAVWGTVALSDAELVAYARGGPYAVGRAITVFYPLYFTSGSSGTTYANFTAATQNNNLTVASGTTAVNPGTHCPCGNPWPAGNR